jgi:type IV pilus assembly protein PilO
MELPAVFDPIVAAPKPQKIAFGVFLLALLGAGVYFLLLSPLQTRVTALNDQAASVQRELIQSRAIVADLARFRQEIAELEQRLAALKERLPTEKETPTLYRSLSTAAIRAGLAVALFQPREPRNRDFYAEIPVTLTAEGTYHQLGEFFESVAKLSRVVNVADLKLSAVGPGKPSLRAELTLATYMYRKAGGSPAPGTPAPPSGKS